MDFFRERGNEFEWTVFDHDTPADLKQSLGAWCFESEALMALALEDAPAGTRSATTADVRAVTDPAWIDAAMDVQRAVWHENFGELAAELRHDLLSDPERLSAYLASLDGEPAFVSDSGDGRIRALTYSQPFVGKPGKTGERADRAVA